MPSVRALWHCAGFPFTNAVATCSMVISILQKLRVYVRLRPPLNQCQCQPDADGKAEDQVRGHLKSFHFLPFFMGRMVMYIPQPAPFPCQRPPYWSTA